jgi:mannose-6-phosphate isomerase-like protein (cupin superfamily)
MRQTGIVPKAWGYENIFATNDLYCGKLLHFTKAGGKFSMHFHQHKDETWYVNSGSFKLLLIDPTNAKVEEKILNCGDSWRNHPCYPHQLIALEDDSEIFEVSTPDSVEDNYRVLPGDSQAL